MDLGEDCNKTITMTELGQRVLTLAEVLQTFENDSNMFNIKLPSNSDWRTVVFKKRHVEIDGKNKVIVMGRDITDKVRL
jgi:hypothetical protein